MKKEGVENCALQEGRPAAISHVSVGCVFFCSVAAASLEIL